MEYSFQRIYKDIVLKLKGIYPDEEARAIADRVFEHYLNLTPAQRVLSGKSPVDIEKIPLIEEAISKLLNRVPLQYVLGTAYFMDIEFLVNPSVLIPRPETEELVSLMLKYYSGIKSAQEWHILDMGTGSGCIAVALKRYLPGSHVSAVDFSQEAIQVAAANADKNNTEVHFIIADMLDRTQWEALPQSDIIVSNPPYVTQAEKTYMLPNVVDFEPHSALFVPDEDPLLFYRSIIAFAEKKLSPHGSLWFEMNEMFGEEVRDLALKQGFTTANIIFDFRGKSRFLHAIR